MKIGPLILNMLVDSLEGLYCFPSSATPLLPASDLALRAPEHGLGFTVVPGVFDNRTVAQNGEVFQANINPSGFSGVRQWFRNCGLGAEAGVPAPALSLESHGLDLAFNGTVQLDLQHPHALNVELAVLPEFAPIPISWEGVAVEPAAGLEPWEARLLPHPDPAEESLEGLVHSPQHVLAGRVVSQVQVACGSNLPDLIGLVVVVEGDLPHAPGVPAFLNGGVIEDAGFRKLTFQGEALQPGGVEPVLEGLTQRNPSVSSFATRYNGKAGNGRLISSIPEKEASGDSSAS